MENTMRWWLLSAEQWRQKWLNVRNERNRLKEENIRLKKELMEIKNKIKNWRYLFEFVKFYELRFRKIG